MENAPVAPDGITLEFHRGERTELFPSAEIRLISGLTVLNPLRGNTVADMFTSLQAKIGETASRDVDAFAQYLRATSRDFAIATARTQAGAFDANRHYYVMRTPRIRLFLWGNDFSVGPPIPTFQDIAQINAHYIVLNADTLANSTILAFGHHTGTHEVTFFTDIPTLDVIRFNNQEIANTPIRRYRDLSFDEKVKYGKIIRPKDKIP